MIYVLRLAALICAALTITLNAKHGYASAVPDYAVLFAMLYASLDLAKCAMLPAVITLWRSKYRLAALVCLPLFFALFANSVWNAVTEVTITRTSAKATAVGDNQTRTRAEADYTRLQSVLRTAQAAPTFQASAACTLPKSNDAKAFCANMAKLKADIDTVAQTLSTLKPSDPTPQNTLIATHFPHLAGNTIMFALALVPVLLAELVGSVGFAIAALVIGKPSTAISPNDTNATQPRKRLARLRRSLAERVRPVWTSSSTSNVGNGSAALPKGAGTMSPNPTAASSIPRLPRMN